MLNNVHVAYTYVHSDTKVPTSLQLLVSPKRLDPRAAHPRTHSLHFFIYAAQCLLHYDARIALKEQPSDRRRLRDRCGFGAEPCDVRWSECNDSEMRLYEFFRHITIEKAAIKYASCKCARVSDD